MHVMNLPRVQIPEVTINVNVVLDTKVMDMIVEMLKLVQPEPIAVMRTQTVFVARAVTTTVTVNRVTKEMGLRVRTLTNVKTDFVPRWPIVPTHQDRMNASVSLVSLATVLNAWT
jgi:hypothetical protein